MIRSIERIEIPRVKKIFVLTMNFLNTYLK